MLTLSFQKHLEMWKCNMVHFCISNLQVLYLFLGILVSFEYHQVDLVKTSVSSLASSSAPSVEQVSIHNTLFYVYLKRIFMFPQLTRDIFTCRNVLVIQAYHNYFSQTIFVFLHCLLF
ncbi:unnamed protein product [Ixodes persulcatus]